MILNFRKIRQEFSIALLEKGQSFVDTYTTSSVKLMSIQEDTIKISCKFNVNKHFVSTSIEFDKNDSSILDSTCSCGASADCLHLTALSIYLEKNFKNIISEQIDATKKESGQDASKEVVEGVKSLMNRTSHINPSSIIGEYVSSISMLSNSPLFNKKLNNNSAQGIKLIIHAFCNWKKHGKNTNIFIKVSLKQSGKKPNHIQNIEEFQQRCRRCDSVIVSMHDRIELIEETFDQSSKIIFKAIKSSISPSRQKPHIGEMEVSSFGELIHDLMDLAQVCNDKDGEEHKVISEIQIIDPDTKESQPLIVKNNKAQILSEISLIYIPSSKITIEPSIFINKKDCGVEIDKCFITSNSLPILIKENTCFLFDANITASHIKALKSLKNTTIPESLFGSFVEKCLPVLMKISKMSGLEKVYSIKSLPVSLKPKAKCIVDYDIDEETLLPQLYFKYGETYVPKNNGKLTISHINSFITNRGVIERDLQYEGEIEDLLFSHFNKDPDSGMIFCKNEKPVVHFMTSIIPAYKDQVEFVISDALKHSFIYDEPKMILEAKYSKNTNNIEYYISIEGAFKDLSVKTMQTSYSNDMLYVPKNTRGSNNCQKIIRQKYIVCSPICKDILNIYRHLKVSSFKDQIVNRPMCSVAYLLYLSENLNDKGISIHIDNEILSIFKNVHEAKVNYNEGKIHNLKNVQLRPYQIAGVNWMKELRSINCNALLADDMGLGKTIQIISLISDYCHDYPNSISIVACPNVLTHNWHLEFQKFSHVSSIVIQGTPQKRKSLIEKAKSEDYNVMIISYSSLQKDIDHIVNNKYDYLVIDEAQYIKNKDTINHTVSRMINAKHIIAATGTPLENITGEIQNILDFLMEGIISNANVKKIDKMDSHHKTVDMIKKTMSPFILRRIKSDVLDDLPPISESEVYCGMSNIQKTLYKSCAKSSVLELYDKIMQNGVFSSRIHIFRCIVRLKQICCHPGIVQNNLLTCSNPSEKYALLMSMIDVIKNSSRRVVIFSQFKSMLDIIKDDLDSQGIKLCYLHGGVKNKQEEISRFENNSDIKIFLISIKSGGVGLNITKADTVIHYDLSWNPSVQKQATDRVHRIGQNKHVLVYKLITKNTIEEKIINKQTKKQQLTEDVIGATYGRVSKMTWEEIEDLLSDNIEESNSEIAKIPEAYTSIVD